MNLVLSLHNPEELRAISNYAHWIEGTIFLAISFILLLKLTNRIGAKKADILWSGLALFSGVFLIVFIMLHHPLSQIGLVWQVVTTDPAQRQHVIMAVLLITASSVQLLLIFRKINGGIWQYVFPGALGIIGLLFILHPQHGTAEAISYMKPYHMVLGSVILIAGLFSGLSLLQSKQKLFPYVSVFFLFISSLLFLFYREPPGSYIMPGMGNQMMNSPNTVSHGGPVIDYVSFIDTLRSKGAKVEPVGEVTQEFFSVKGNGVAVNDESVQVFEYSSTADTNKDASKVSPDGSSIGTTMVAWIAPPHFYKKERIIVLYIGNNQKIISLLISVLGKQFAGG